MRSLALRPRAIVFSLLLGLIALRIPAAIAQTPPAKLPDPPPSIAAGSAVLIVDPPAGAAESDALLQRRINTHAATLGSEQHLRKLLRSANSEMRKTQWFLTANDPLERAAWLRDHLRITPIPGTSLIQISLNDLPDPPERKIVLQEICQHYLDDESGMRSNALLDRTQMLNQVKDKIQVRLNVLIADMKEKQIKLNIEGGGIGRLGVKEMELSKLVSEQVEAFLKMNKDKAAYEAAIAAAKREESFPGLQGMIQQMAPFLIEDEHQLRQVEIERDLLADQAGANDPKYQALVQRATRMRAAWQKKLDETRAKAKIGILEELQQKANVAEAKYVSLSRRVDLLKQDIGDLSNSMIQYTILQQEEKGLREQLKSIREQIDNIMTLQASRATTDIHWHLMPDVAAP